MASEMSFVTGVAGVARKQAGLLAVAQRTNATGADAFLTAVQELAGTVPAATPLVGRAGDLAAAAAAPQQAVPATPTTQVRIGATDVLGRGVAGQLVTQQPIVVPKPAVEAAPTGKQQHGSTQRNKGPGLNS